MNINNTYFFVLKVIIYLNWLKNKFDILKPPKESGIMNKLSGALKNMKSKTKTENEANAYKDSGSDLLNFFARSSAMRKANKKEIYSLFDKAFLEDKKLALKALFYLRDIRGGQGERRAFKAILNELAYRYPEYIKKNLDLISFYGRYDDYYALFDTPLEKEVALYLKNQIKEDLNKEDPSLCAKWLKSENASSDETIRLAKKTINHFGWSERKYRKTLSKLRKKIDIVERKMSNNDWQEIEYDKVPSKATMKYIDAFYRHDQDGYEKFQKQLESGEKNINAGSLYPYEIIREIENIIHNVFTFDYIFGEIKKEKIENNKKENMVKIKTLEEQWKALNDYIDGEKSINNLCVVDVSGSMEGLPMQVAVSLGMYFAERAEGPYKDHFITFSNKPEMIKITGSTLYDKVFNMERSDWDNNTNIEAVFDLILDKAVKNNVIQSEMPDKIFIISDMEFDMAINNNSKDVLFEKLRKKYKEYFYELPKLYFWNVDSRQNNFPVTKDTENTALISGFSPSVFEYILKDKKVNPYQLMVDVLNSERYERVVV